MLLSLLYVNTAVPSSFSVLPIFSRLDKLLYFIYKQEYLEFISRNENQKGLHFLYKYIKPLESVCEAQHAGEFKELCYLLSFKVRSLPLLVSPERSELSLLRALARRAEVPGDSRRHAVARVLRRERDSRKASRFCVRLISQVPPNRLVTLLKQAYSYQASQTFPNTPRSMRIVSLLEDINGYPLPSFLEDCQQHVEGPIKGVAVLCESSVAVSARNALYVWNRQEPDPTLKRIGGHNGLKSVIAELGSTSFRRLRIGVGRPEKSGTADYVLSKFDGAEAERFNLSLDAAAEAVRAALTGGMSRAMNKFNAWTIPAGDEEKTNQPQ